MVTSRLKPIASRKKVEAAQKALKDLALQLGAYNKMPTVREICKSLNISGVTAAHALALLGEQGVIVSRQGSGIYVSPRLYQKNIGLVFGSNPFAAGASPFCQLLVEGCQKRALSHNENFSYFLDIPQHLSPEPQPVHADLAEALAKKRLDGILLAMRNSVEQETWLRQQGMPVVSFAGGVVKPYQPGTIGFDVEELTSLAVKSLVHRGCRQLALVSVRRADVPAYEKAMQAMGLSLRSSQVINIQYLPSGQSREQAGRQALEQILAAGPCDGVVVTDDMFAVGVIAAARQQNLVVGRDILIATHANRGSVTLQPSEDFLIRVEVDPGEIVEAMFGFLEQLMTEKTEAHGAAIPLHVLTGNQVNLSNCITDRQS